MMRRMAFLMERAAARSEAVIFNDRRRECIYSIRTPGSASCVAQVSKPAVSPTSKSAGRGIPGWAMIAIRRFGNPRHGRFGNLRYDSETPSAFGKLRLGAGRRFLFFSRAATRSEAVILDDGRRE